MIENVTVFNKEPNKPNNNRNINNTCMIFSYCIYVKYCFAGKTTESTFTQSIGGTGKQLQTANDIL